MKLNILGQFGSHSTGSKPQTMGSQSVFTVTNDQYMVALSGGKSTQLSCLSKSKDTLIENDSSKSESHPVKY